jgi:hypothetical protein
LNGYFRYEKNNKTMFDKYSRTPDEDFSIVLEAALMYDRCVTATLGEDSMDEGQLWIDIKNGKQFAYPRLRFIPFTSKYHLDHQVFRMI